MAAQRRPQNTLRKYSMNCLMNRGVFYHVTHLIFTFVTLFMKKKYMETAILGSITSSCSRRKAEPKGAVEIEPTAIII